MTDFFDKNLAALARNNPGLAARLRAAKSVPAPPPAYLFRESRAGGTVPVRVTREDNPRPLHSLVDPRKEARRLAASFADEGFLVFAGLGGGYYPAAALEREETLAVLVIEYGAADLACLLRGIDYTPLFNDPRFTLLSDPEEAEIESRVLAAYLPVLHGGLRLVPLLPRTTLDSGTFSRAAAAVSGAAEKVSADYSTQAHFGTRWFSNIVRNIISSRDSGAFHRTASPREDANPKRARAPLPFRAEKAAVCAAGPSLSLQIPEIKRERNKRFLIAVDTSLPCLLASGIIPDAVISIDCQHISFRHFTDGIPPVPLFLDLASPPLLSALAGSVYFFSGGHPLARYARESFPALPEIDCSGGNVTHAAVSLAEYLGASEITLYGADFSYPRGIAYARGAYVYPYFENKAGRLAPLEALCSAFLYRAPLEKIQRRGSWYYETGILKFYRRKLEEKSGNLRAALVQAEGGGAPVHIRAGKTLPPPEENFSPGRPGKSAEEFLSGYALKIKALPSPSKNPALYLESLKGKEDLKVFATLLPAAAAIKKRNPKDDFGEIFEKTRAFCLKRIQNALDTEKENAETGNFFPRAL